jgi:hypothetical protein
MAAENASGYAEVIPGDPNCVITVAVGTTIADRPRRDPYEHVYAYGSYQG